MQQNGLQEHSNYYVYENFEVIDNKTMQVKEVPPAKKTAKKTPFNVRILRTYTNAIKTVKKGTLYTHKRKKIIIKKVSAPPIHRTKLIRNFPNKENPTKASSNRK